MSHFILFMFIFSCHWFNLFSQSEATSSQHKGRSGYFLIAFSLYGQLKKKLKISPSTKLQSRALRVLVIAVLFVQMVLGSVMADWKSASTLQSCPCYLTPEAEGFHLRHGSN